MTGASRHEELFLELVVALQQSAWLALGKIAHPATGKTEVQLEAATHAIDMLAMLQDKARPTLSSQERALLDNALTQLRLNYVEAAAAKNAPKPPEATDPTGAAGSPPPEAAD